MNRNLAYRIFIILIVLVAFGSSAFAAVKLPAIFGDNMVLQSNMKVPMWGWADAGEKVQVTFMGHSFKTIAGTDGKWNLKLNSNKPGGPYQMTIKGNSGSFTYKNILIGEVWVASGQSNMEFGIKNEKNGAEAVANAHDSLIHLFTVPISISLNPQSDIDIAKAETLTGKWIVCSPENLLYDHTPWSGFSAIGYNFALHIREISHAPVGIIGTYKNGSPAQAWISIEGLKVNSAFARYVNAREENIAHLDEETKTYPQKIEVYKAALDQYTNTYAKPYNDSVKQWEAIKAKGGLVPPHPKPPKPAPSLPVPPDGGFSGPANIFNAMVNPILHYGIKGVIWYQGENNGDSFPAAINYKTLFLALIENWRSEWQQSDFPFLFVQLANFRDPAVSPSEGNWPWVREGQSKALELPKTGMAVAIDLGDTYNIHPTDKQDVALRLSLAARHVAYGENVVYSGPVYKSVEFKGDKATLTFNNTSELKIGNETTMKVENGTPLKGFGIAGADHKFYWADATIVNNTVVVSSDKVSNPEAVRYNWADNPPGNLYNGAGLPASPFRTDNWTENLPVKTN